MPDTELAHDGTGANKSDPNGLLQTSALELGRKYKQIRRHTSLHQPPGTANCPSL